MANSWDAWVQNFDSKIIDKGKPWKFGIFFADNNKLTTAACHKNIEFQEGLYDAFKRSYDISKQADPIFIEIEKVKEKCMHVRTNPYDDLAIYRGSKYMVYVAEGDYGGRTCVMIAVYDKDMQDGKNAAQIYKARDGLCPKKCKYRKYGMHIMQDPGFFPRQGQTCCMK